ncbi:MAG: hypothetical protein IKB28_02085 [Clostridia bacterium]|nr:hypothetical protein [Clostridia bacterium]
MADGYKKKKKFQKKSPTRTTVIDGKFLIDLHPNGSPPQDESFRPPFSKGGGGLGQSPKSRPQARNLPNAVLFGTFSCGYIAKKKYGESFLNVTCPDLFRSFFGKVGQRKNQRKAVGEISRLRARRGLCPRPATFLKKGRSKTFLLRGGFVWVKAGANFHQGRVRVVAVICGRVFL